MTSPDEYLVRIEAAHDQAQAALNDCRTAFDKQDEIAARDALAYANEQIELSRRLQDELQAEHPIEETIMSERHSPEFLNDDANPVEMCGVGDCKLTKRDCETPHADEVRTHPADKRLAQALAPEISSEWPMSNMLEAAWGIIANVNFGDWEGEQSPAWNLAAQRWREAYHQLVKAGAVGDDPILQFNTPKQTTFLQRAVNAVGGLFALALVIAAGLTIIGAAGRLLLYVVGASVQ